MSTFSNQPLHVFLYGTHVAVIRRRMNNLEMSWTAEAVERWGVGSRVLSNLLPIDIPARPPQPAKVQVFISGLLAEGNLREHLAFEAGVTSDDVFGLIARYGRDTAGALTFLPADEDPKEAGHLEPVSEPQIAEMLRAAGRFSPDTLESNSLAGVQPKIVLRKDGDNWFRCLDGAPSTHIIKLGHPSGSPIADVIDTEAAALELARTVGLTTIEATIASFENVRALVVSRYDRAITTEGSVERIHQEDTAQALGINTDDLNRKFQRGKLLPSLKAIANVLRNGGTEPDALLELTTFNLAIGNTDAHAKNISLIRHENGRSVLAPTYDVAMHAHHASFSGLFAMDVAGRQRMSEIGHEELQLEAQDWPLPALRAERAITTTLEALLEALANINRANHPGVSAAAWELVEARTAQLLQVHPP